MKIRPKTDQELEKWLDKTQVNLKKLSKVLISVGALITLSMFSFKLVFSTDLYLWIDCLKPLPALFLLDVVIRFASIVYAWILLYLIKNDDTN